MDTIDLNSDMGESFGMYHMGNDIEMMRYVTSINIACGFHAGDPRVMHQTVEAAIAKGLRIGAHPGLPDLVGFGRRNMAISKLEAYDMMIYQIGALNGFVAALGGRLSHVKPHGALYNMAVKSKDLSQAIAKAIYDIDADLILYGLAGSELVSAAEQCGLRVANEVFADRTYQVDGTLTPRTEKNCFIETEDQAIQQVMLMVKEKKVSTLQGKIIPIQADTVCIHGDGPHALEFAQRLNADLGEHGINIASIDK